MGVGAWVLVAAVVLAVGFGLYRASVDGRFRGTHPVGGRGARRPGAEPRDPRTDAGPQPLDLTGLDLTLGEKATLLQFSSAFCAPCRTTRRVLSEVVEVVPGVTHHEVDAEHHLDLVRRLGVLRTPTTLVLDASGVEVSRAAGAPTKQQVLAQLGALA